MTSESPIRVDVTSPAHFERVQLLLRILLAIALGVVGITTGWLVWLLYVALPVIAAIAISSFGAARYMGEVGPRIWRVLAWLLQLSAYMLILVDRFPTGEEHPVHVEIRVSGTPTIGSALLRLLTSIPSGLVLMVLWLVSFLAWLYSAALVLFEAQIPRSILGFQRAVLRWQAHLVAYHASLVEEYPPFALHTEDTPMTGAIQPAHEVH
jgi:hypothetical protein